MRGLRDEELTLKYRVTPIHCDSQSAIHLTIMRRQSTLMLDTFFVQDIVDKGDTILVDWYF